MNDLIGAILDTGMDIGTRSSLKAVLLKLGFDINLVDQIYVKMKNDAHAAEFARTAFTERAVFMPHCMRSSEKCKAPMTDEGYQCLKCGACRIGKIKSEAERLGYGGFYIVPGGSMVFKIMARRKYKAIIGVACYYELADSMEKASLFRIPAQGVPLGRDGCKDTLVEVEPVVDKMSKRR
ncbi:MAG: DUF116 domain-containing protein [Methanobacteriota archaeon]